MFYDFTTIFVFSDNIPSFTSASSTIKILSRTSSCPQTITKFSRPGKHAQPITISSLITISNTNNVTTLDITSIFIRTSPLYPKFFTYLKKIGRLFSTIQCLLFLQTNVCDSVCLCLLLNPRSIGLIQTLWVNYIVSVYSTCDF